MNFKFHFGFLLCFGEVSPFFNGFWVLPLLAYFLFCEGRPSSAGLLLDGARRVFCMTFNQGRSSSSDGWK